MGHSFIELDGQSVLLHDVEIDLARHFLTLGTERMQQTSEAEAFRCFLADWQDFGPGVFGANLGEFIAGQPERRAFLLSVMAAAIGVVQRFGEEVPLEYLSACSWQSGRQFFGSYPVSRVVRILELLQGLVPGT
jgi:hypothetical protein